MPTKMDAHGISRQPEMHIDVINMAAFSMHLRTGVHGMIGYASLQLNVQILQCQLGQKQSWLVMARLFGRDSPHPESFIDNRKLSSVFCRSMRLASFENDPFLARDFRLVLDCQLPNAIFGGTHML